jgi:hypothetical protein
MAGSFSSDDLLEMSLDAYQDIRRTAAIARREGRAEFVCDKCGFAVYAPLEPKTRQPYWRHFKGAPTNCPWWTGDPKTIDQIGASQFDGKQESPLHFYLKQKIAALLLQDPLTEEETLRVDKYIHTAEGRRRPDVSLRYDGKDLAIEIQLATTNLPTIVARESFYESNRRHLIWVTWNFDPVDPTVMLASFRDIFYSHNKNMFSIDAEIIETSESAGAFYLKVFLYHEGNLNSEIVQLSSLIWGPISGLPYYKDGPSRWSEECTESVIT